MVELDMFRNPDGKFYVSVTSVWNLLSERFRMALHQQDLKTADTIKDIESCLLAHAWKLYLNSEGTDERKTEV